MCLADNSYDERRSHVSIKLFRSLLAADLDLKKKLTEDGQISLYLIYQNTLSNTENVSTKILGKNKKGIKKIPVITTSLKIDDLIKTEASLPVPSGIFLTERLSKDRLNKLIRYGIKHHIIVFSPFEGDVEKGIVAGVSIKARIKPLLNIRTLKQSQLQIKSFFLKIASRYED